MSPLKSHLAYWFNPFWCIIFVAYNGLLAVISVFAYRSELAGVLTANDKLGHFVLFGSAGLLCHLALNQRCWQWRRLKLPIGPILIALLVVVDELFQSLSPNRTAGIADLIANWLGILFFVSVGDYLVRRSKRKAQS